MRLKNWHRLRSGSDSDKNLLRKIYKQSILFSPVQGLEGVGVAIEANTR